MGIKTQNLPKMTRFCLWSFYKGVLWDDHLSKMTTCDWSQEWSSYTGLAVYINMNTLVIFDKKELVFLQKQCYLKVLLGSKTMQKVLFFKDSEHCHMRQFTKVMLSFWKQAASWFRPKEWDNCQIMDVFKETDKLSVLLHYTSMV